jgi:hypothetical protein
MPFPDYRRVAEQPQYVQPPTVRRLMRGAWLVRLNRNCVSHEYDGTDEWRRPAVIDVLEWAQG